MSTCLALALPVDEETVLVHLENAGQLQFSVVLLLRPAVEGAAVQQALGHWNLPVEVEALGHLGGMCLVVLLCLCSEPIVVSRLTYGAMQEQCWTFLI